MLAVIKLAMARLLLLGNNKTITQPASIPHLSAQDLIHLFGVKPAGHTRALIHTYLGVS